MIPLLAGAAWLAVVLWLLSRMLRQFRIHAAEALAAPDPRFVARAVRVIIPARNEIANIEACVRGLVAQTQVQEGYSVLVVDDTSQDGTAEAVRRLAAAEPRLALMEAGALPAGWMGKPHACWRGALAAPLASPAEWLCFVDADVRTAPVLVAAAVQAAERNGVDMLSLLPRHALGSFWERLIIPTGLLMIACARSLRFNPNRMAGDVAVNGQFILVRRTAYFAVGGHASVRAELCEDKALARRIRESGFRYAVMAAEPFLHARLYFGLSALWQGFARSGVEIMGSTGRTLVVAVAALAAGWAAPLAPLLAAAAAWMHPGPGAWCCLALSVAGSGVVLGALLGTARHFGISRGFALLFPLGTTIAAAIAFHGSLPGPRRRLRWKGRRCIAAPASPEPG